MAFTDDFSGLSDNDKLDVSSDWTQSPSGDVRWFLDKQTGTREFLEGRRNTGFAATQVAFICPDQGSADHYTQTRRYGFNTDTNLLTCVRLVDKDNCCGFYLAGTGTLGLRLAKRISGTITELIQTQGSSDEWVRVEAEGTTYSLWTGGTGSTPGTWSQQGSDQTIADGDLSSSETSQGFAVCGSIADGDDYFSDFEAGALGGGTGPTTSPWGHQRLDSQYSAIAASRLNGVLQ